MRDDPVGADGGGDRTGPGPAPRRPLALWAGGLAGPMAAIAYEADVLDVFSAATLGNLGLVTALAVAGLGCGVVAVLRGSRAAGIALVVLNSAVLALYGFLLFFFFLLGGSR